MTNKAAPKVILELNVCNCKKGCKSNACSCRRNNSVCTDACKCKNFSEYQNDKAPQEEDGDIDD